MPEPITKPNNIIQNRSSLYPRIQFSTPNTRRTAKAAEAAPEEKEHSQEELYELAVGGDTTEAFALDSGTYAGPEQIDFTFGPAEALILAALELLIITAAVCKGGLFIFTMQPRQIMTTLS